VRDFTIHVSADGGSFLPRLVDTPDLERTFEGDSTARDRLFNAEAGGERTEGLTTVDTGRPAAVCGGQIPGDINQDGRLDIADATPDACTARP
jgi:hypothetical protein